MPPSINAIGRSLTSLQIRPHTPAFRPCRWNLSLFDSSPLLWPGPGLTSIMAQQSRKASASSDTPRQIAPARPSSSVVLVSPNNQVLLLHRVQTSTSFASAHVFPGGNLDEFHDGAIPDVESPERHKDGLAYRLGAIRETFEETGILLAKKNGELVNLGVEERDAARKKIHGNQVKFQDWVESLGATPDLGMCICTLSQGFILTHT